MKFTGFNSYKSWGIAIVCSIVNFVSLLPVRISGLIYVALIEYYSISRKMASQPIMISVIIRTSIGPLVGYLGGKYECRTIMIWGAILSSVGVGACYFAVEMTFVTISIGLIYGVGLAFGNTLVPLILKQHFDKHVSKANGLALMGCCLNAVIMPPIFEYFLKTYGLPGAFLITSGIMLNGLPAALILKNPKYRRTQLPKKDEEKESEGLPNIFVIDDEIVMPHSYDTEKVMTTLDLEDLMLQSGSLHCSTISLATLDERNSLVLDALDCNVCVIKAEGSNEEIDAFIGINEHGVTDVKPLPHEAKEPMGRTQIDEGSSIDGDFDGVTDTKPLPHKTMQPMGWKRFSVFKQPSYIIILTTQAIQALMITVWTIIIDLSRDKGIPSHQELYFLMFLPVSELFGLVGLTWLPDSGYLSTTKFCACCYVCLAISCGCLVWSQAFWTMMTAVLCFSFFTASISTTIPVMVLELIEEKHHAMAMASRYMLFGPIGLTMPFVIGFFRENVGSYDGLLYLLASSCLLSSFLFILLPHIVSCRSKKESS